jgi:hypothetical protein
VAWLNCYRVDDVVVLKDHHMGRFAGAMNLLRIRVARLLWCLQVVLPPMVPSSLGFVRPDGAYLIDNGQALVVWLGRDLPAAWLGQVCCTGLPHKGVGEGEHCTARQEVRLFRSTATICPLYCCLAAQWLSKSPAGLPAFGMQATDEPIFSGAVA